MLLMARCIPAFFSKAGSERFVNKTLCLSVRFVADCRHVSLLPNMLRELKGANLRCSFVNAFVEGRLFREIPLPIWTKYNESVFERIKIRRVWIYPNGIVTCFSAAFGVISGLFSHSEFTNANE